MNNPVQPDQTKGSPVTVSHARFKSSLISFLFSIKNIFASTQSVIGIDVGYSYIKILQLHKAGKKYIITNCITRAIPQVIKDNPPEKRRLVQEFVKELSPTRG
ncbi:MAG: hypothetical protein V2A64_03135 [Candidatus Omnitrophota bacterium]